MSHKIDMGAFCAVTNGQACWPACNCCPAIIRKLLKSAGLHESTATDDMYR
jgi:hypothetical protein